MALAEKHEISEIDETMLRWEDKIFLSLIKKPMKEGFDKTKPPAYRLGFAHGSIRTVFFLFEGQEAATLLQNVIGLEHQEIVGLQEDVRQSRFQFEQNQSAIVAQTEDEALVGQYQDGYGNGQISVISYKGIFKKPESTTFPYMMMLLLRREINRAPTIEYIHQQLTTHYPEIFSYSLESFKVLCNRINLRGRNYISKRSG